MPQPFVYVYTTYIYTYIHIYIHMRYIYIYMCDIYIYGMCIYIYGMYTYIYMYIHVLRYHRFVFESSQCANGLSASGSTCTTWRSPASIASNSWFGKSQRSATQCGSKYMAQNIYIFIDIYIYRYIYL
jgi:hypothetical protein